MSKGELSNGNILKQLDKVTKKRKKTVNQKHKGKRGESWFADKLSDISGSHFHRIYASGASVGKSNNELLESLTQSQAESQLGDIHSPEDFVYYLVWESKNYQDLDFHNLIGTQNKFSKTVLGWLSELEFDLQSAFTKMKDNYRPIVGFLCIKVTRKGSWIIGNDDYIKKTCFKNKEMKVGNILYFINEPNEVLKKYGFGNKYFMTDFESFVRYNKDILFKVDKDKKERLEKAKEAFNKIYNGDQ